ncbi:hypothetical protein [Mycolicibacterium septicum]|uniref:hypothetical protein n=1 Tax=Mycolicibacterium septicum TaxID=98668 RepID=UPI001AFACC32|nr:hypothetical protein [Mycolicibacterium septicum]QRY51711.1 hypothetical protein JVX95_30770 [Mycolicibacterium septicum]
MTNPYSEGSPEHLLYEIFSEPPIDTHPLTCPAGRGELNYFVTRDGEYEDYRHEDDNTTCRCEEP